MSYDPEKTSMSIREMGGSNLNPLNMIHQDLQTAFRIIGEHKKEAEDEAQEQASLKTEVANLKAQLATLQNRLWGLLAGVILAGAGAAWSMVTG